MTTHTETKTTKGETWASANARMSCFDCGESGAHPYTTNAGPNPGKHVRVCRLCDHRWAWLDLRARDRMYEETQYMPEASR